MSSRVLPAARIPVQPRLVTGAFMLLLSGHFLQALGYSSMLLLPLYLAQLGASRTVIGSIMAAASISGLIVRPLIGFTLDTWGRRPVLLVGTVLMVVAVASVGLVQDLGPLIYIDRLVFGIAVGALFTGYFTFAADLIPEQRRTEGIALFGISGLVPLFINGLAGQLHLGSSGLRMLFPVVAGIIAFSYLPLLLVKEPVRDVALARFTWRGLVGELRQRQLWPTWLATALFSSLLAVFMAFATVAAQRRGLAQPANLWLTYAAGAVAIRLFGARLPDRVGPANLMAPSFLLYGTGLLLAASAQGTTGFLLAGLFAGIGHGYCFPVLTSQVVSRSDPAVRGSVVAVFSALWELSAIVMTPLFGRIADTYDDATMFSLAVVVATFGLVAWLVMEHRLVVQPSPT